MKSSASIRSRFLGNMSHELRTPLNAILGFAAVLAKNSGGRLEDRELRYLERIRENGHLLLRLIEELLEKSRVDAGGGSSNPEKLEPFSDPEELAPLLFRRIK